MTYCPTRDRWVSVQKNRWLRKFSADNEDLVEISVNQGAFPQIGCNVELTQVKVDSVVPDWLSLGFEAFGPPSENMRTIFRTLKRFFDLVGPFLNFQLTGRDSLSYPTWLSTQAKVRIRMGTFISAQNPRFL